MCNCILLVVYKLVVNMLAENSIHNGIHNVHHDHTLTMPVIPTLSETRPSWRNLPAGLHLADGRWDASYQELRDLFQLPYLEECRDYC